MPKKINTLADLTPDRRNANKGTQRGLGLLDKSLRQYGAGRSILADKNGVVMAGNKTLERAADIGLPVRVVQTDGKELVVVQRTDLDLTTDKAAKELAIADNRVGQIDLDWEPDVLKELAGEIDLSQFFKPDELAGIIGQADTLAGVDVVPEQWMVLVTCHDEQEQAILLEQLTAEGRQCRALVS